MIYEHILTFKTSEQAIAANRLLPLHIQVLRSKACEHEERPVVIFQTQDRLEHIECGLLIHALAPERVDPNKPLQSDLPVQASFPEIDWSQVK